MGKHGGGAPIPPYWDGIKRTAREEGSYGRHRMRRPLFEAEIALGGAGAKSKGRAWPWSEPAPLRMGRTARRAWNKRSFAVLSFACSHFSKWSMG